MEYTNRIVKNTIQLFILSIVGVVLGFLLRVFLSRTLTVVDYGLFYTILAFVGIFTPLKELGLHETFIKFIPEFIINKKLNKIKYLFVLIISIQISASIIIAIPLIVFSDYISVVYFGNIAASLPLKLIILSFIFSVFITIFRSTLQGFNKIFSYALVEPLRLLISFVFIIGFIWMGITGAAIGYLAASIILPLILLPIIRKCSFTKEKFLIDLKLGKNALIFGFSLVLGGIGSIILAYTDTLIIKVFGTLKDVALYQVALPTVQLLSIVPGVFYVILLPLVSELWAKKQKDKLQDAISLFLKFGLIIVVFLSIWLISFSNIIISTLFGGVYVGASGALIILSFGVIFNTMATIIWFSLIGMGRPFIVTKIILLVALLNLVSNIFFVPTFGFIGAAISNAISYFIGALISLYYIKSKFSFSINVYSLLKIIFCGILSFLSIYIIKTFISSYLEVILSLVIGTTVYFGSIVLLNVVIKKDLNALKLINIRLPKFTIKWLKIVLSWFV